jgi:hypothetical protein
MRPCALKHLIAKIGIAAVLFAQLALAAHACTTMNDPASGLRLAMASDMHAAMPGCPMAGDENPNLCLQHCTAGNQSVQNSSHVPVPAITSMVILTLAPVQTEPGAGITALSAVLERETSPPPLVRFHVLRI